MNTPSPDGSTPIDGDAFARMLLRDHAGALVLLARRFLDDETDVQDVVQEALASAVSGREGFRGESTLRTWLHRITVNAALKRLRTVQRRAEVDVGELLPVFDAHGGRIESLHAPPTPTDALVESREIRMRVREAIAMLPDIYRTAVLLRDIEGYSTSEAAMALGITEGALKVRLHRGRAALKKLLEPELRGAA